MANEAEGIMSAEFYRRLFVLAYGAHAGCVQKHPDGWRQAFDMFGKPIGSWSTDRRALHVIEQNMLLNLYGTHQRAENEY
jgi:hypothetical protein